MANDQAEPSQPPVGTTNKPPELLELATISAELFAKLKSWFDVPNEVTMSLASVAGADVIADLQDGRKVAAFAMRKLQALHLTAQPVPKRELTCHSP